MLKSNEQFTEAANQTVDTAREFIKTSLEGVEKLAKFNLDVSKKLLEETTDAIKDIAAVKNPKDLLDKVNTIATNSVESHLSNCRSVYEIISNAQAKMGKMFESQLQNTQQSMANAVDGISQLQGRGNFAADSMKSWLNTTNQAMDTMNKMAEQVTEFTNSNIKAATNATANTVKNAASQKNK
jgi:phasin family protein